MKILKIDEKDNKEYKHCLQVVLDTSDYAQLVKNGLFWGETINRFQLFPNIVDYNQFNCPISVVNKAVSEVLGEGLAQGVVKSGLKNCKYHSTQDYYLDLICCRIDNANINLIQEELNRKLSKYLRSENE